MRPGRDRNSFHWKLQKGTSPDDSPILTAEAKAEPQGTCEGDKPLLFQDNFV